MVAAVFVLGFNLSALTEAQERKDKKILDGPDEEEIPLGGQSVLLCPYNSLFAYKETEKDRKMRKKNE